MTSPGSPRPAPARKTTTTYALVRVPRLDLDSFARAAGVHPELVRRLVVLGLIDADQDARGRLFFRPGQLAVMARIQRLRAGFGLNYAAVGLVLDLLDRIDLLDRLSRLDRVDGGVHRRLRTGPRPNGGSTWTHPA
jgi:DNA-binding transcriptional MerR regulator